MAYEIVIDTAPHPVIVTYRDPAMTHTNFGLAPYADAAVVWAWFRGLQP